MKKLLSVCLVLVMVMCFSVTAFAEGGFVSSPSGNLAPEIIEPGDGSIEIHSYAERHELDENKRKEFEDAYNSIKDSPNLDELNSQLGEIAKDKNISTSDLSVSDLFNISYNGSGASGTQTIKLKSDTFNNFVALMVFVNGKWQLVDGARMENGNLVFDATHFGPYAVVVNTAATTAPQTGINGNAKTDDAGVFVYGTLMLISACGALVMWRKSKKYTA